MNREEALLVALSELEAWRRHTWTELCRAIGEPQHVEVTGASGACYQVEVQAFWDNQPDGAIRVTAHVDDGGWRAFLPLTTAFIIAPDGTVIGE